MSKRVILFVALESELPKSLVPMGVDIHYTGVGKVNAAIKAAEILLTARTFGATSDDLIVLNYGSAGGMEDMVTQLFKCKNFIQKDIDASPFAKRTVTPFDDVVYPKLGSVDEISFGAGYYCYTQDKFDSNPDGISDMEAYSIAKVCKINGYDFTSYKYVSDSGNADDWTENHNKGIDLFLEELNKLI